MRYMIILLLLVLFASSSSLCAEKNLTATRPTFSLPSGLTESPRPPSRTANEPPVVVWEQPLEGRANERLIVVQDKIVGEAIKLPNGIETVSSALRYTFLLASTEGNRVRSRVLWTRGGDLTLAGLDPRIELLDTCMHGNDLFVAFNQRGSCWAYVVRQARSGKTDVQPRVDRIEIGAELAVGPKVERATTRFEGGEPVLQLIPANGRSTRYVLIRDGDAVKWKSEAAAKQVE
jgi:hypothetical protein